MVSDCVVKLSYIQLGVFQTLVLVCFSLFFIMKDFMGTDGLCGGGYQAGD